VITGVFAHLEFAQQRERGGQLAIKAAPYGALALASAAGSALAGPAAVRRATRRM
jgi:hypothetical protein